MALKHNLQIVFIASSVAALSALSLLSTVASSRVGDNYHLRDWSFWGPFNEAFVDIAPRNSVSGAPTVVIDAGPTSARVDPVGIYQEFKADKYRGKRVCLSANLKTIGKNAWSGLWMTVEDPNGQGVAFDNMENRPVRAAKDFRHCKVILDVPLDASAIMIGCAVHGHGKALLSGVEVGVVDKKAKRTALAVDDQKYPVTGRVGEKPSFEFANRAKGGDENLQLTGWSMHASREYAIDADSAGPGLYEGQASGHIKSLQDDARGFATIYQTVSATRYRGKKLRFSARVKTHDVEDWAGLWLRIDGAGKVQAFDNMEKRPIKGTTDWTQYSVVLPVSANAYSLKAGLMLAGKGQTWINDCKLEAVSDDVATTVPSTKAFTIPRPELFEAPHLEFVRFAEK